MNEAGAKTERTAKTYRVFVLEKLPKNSCGAFHLVPIGTSVDSRIEIVSELTGPRVQSPEHLQETRHAFGDRLFLRPLSFESGRIPHRLS
jgi:hypothetical protein